MKLVSFNLLRPEQRLSIKNFYFKTPFLSARHIQRHYHSPLWPVLSKFILSLSGLIFLVVFARFFLRPLNWWKITLFVPSIFFITETLGSLGQLVFFNSQIPATPIHKSPLSSSSLGDFWGKRWNLWVQDWLRDISSVYGKRVKSKIALAFIASGIFHEMMANLPWWLYNGESYFGNMLLYFSIQGLGLWVEKKWLRGKSKWLKRFYLWALVIIPSPLFINRPLLVFIGVENV